MDEFDYEELVHTALISVVRDVLISVQKVGLCDNHHFYISFKTDHLGVEISQALRDKYPSEMMIVLQYQFWDLKITNVGFSVTLSFGGVREHLKIPFLALTAFVDPSVKFGLQFTPVDAPITPDNLDEKIISFDSFRKK